jgi:hypothetical protein
MAQSAYPIFAADIFVRPSLVVVIQTDGSPWLRQFVENTTEVPWPLGFRYDRESPNAVSEAPRIDLVADSLGDRSFITFAYCNDPQRFADQLRAAFRTFANSLKRADFMFLCNGTHIALFTPHFEAHKQMSMEFQPDRPSIVGSQTGGHFS